MYTFGIISVVAITIAIVAVAASGFRKRFNRNFIFTGTAAGIVLGEIGILAGFFIYTNNYTEGSARTFDGITSIAPVMMELITFSVNVNSTINPVLFDFASGIFCSGIVIFLLAWLINFAKSNFIWGIIQNILQTIIVTAFSVIIVAGALLFADKAKKVAKKN